MGPLGASVLCKPDLARCQQAQKVQAKAHLGKMPSQFSVQSLMTSVSPWPLTHLVELSVGCVLSFSAAYCMLEKPLPLSLTSARTDSLKLGRVLYIPKDISCLTKEAAGGGRVPVDDRCLDCLSLWLDNFSHVSWNEFVVAYKDEKRADIQDAIAQIQTAQHPIVMASGQRKLATMSLAK